MRSGRQLGLQAGGVGGHLGLQDGGVEGQLGLQGLLQEVGGVGGWHLGILGVTGVGCGCGCGRCHGGSFLPLGPPGLPARSITPPCGGTAPPWGSRVRGLVGLLVVSTEALPCLRSSGAGVVGWSEPQVELSFHLAPQGVEVQGAGCPAPPCPQKGVEVELKLPHVAVEVVVVVEDHGVVHRSLNSGPSWRYFYLKQ